MYLISASTFLWRKEDGLSGEKLKNAHSGYLPRIDNKIIQKCIITVDGNAKMYYYISTQ
jgi:hypothetical protein